MIFPRGCDMLMKRYSMHLAIMILFVLAASTAHAVPSVPSGGKLELYTRWWTQFSGGWQCDIFADPGHGRIENCTKSTPGTMSRSGCTTTALAMLYRYYEMKWIPNQNHLPDFFDDPQYPYLDYLYSSLNPGTLNAWLTDNRSYNSSKNLGLGRRSIKILLRRLALA